jgi:pre-mRNA-processing factor 40
MDSFPPQPEKDLKEILDDLLREKNVSSNASWEYALKLIGNDPRYELFRHHPERKQMFNNYKIQKSKEEKEEQRAKTKKGRENLEKMLYTSEKMNSSIRYRQACEIFALSDAWKAVPDNDRREIFREVVEEMTVKEREAMKAIRKRNMKVLADILNGMTSVSHRTRWSEAQQQLLDNPTFSEDSDLLAMDKEDALIVFEDHIRDLEKEEEEERRREKSRIYRTQRKNREAFVQLLESMHKQGKLTFASKWSTLYPEISTDSRFIAMLSQPLSGSTSLDLFKFFVDDLRNRYEEEKEVVKDIMRKNTFEFVLTTSFEEYTDLLSKDDRGAKVSTVNVRSIFERLQAKVQEKEKERLRVENKRKKRIESAFMNLLHSLEPAVNETSVWDHVRKAIADDEAFTIIPTEEERISLFKMYIQTIQETCSHHHSKSKKKSASKKKQQRRRSLSRSSASESGEEYGPDEYDREEGEERQRRRRLYKRSPSRSKSPVRRHDSRSRSYDREPVPVVGRGEQRSSRKSRSRSLSSESGSRPLADPTTRSHSPPVSQLPPASNCDKRETESETSDIEELEKQRQLLLSQLAAAANR